MMYTLDHAHLRYKGENVGKRSDLCKHISVGFSLQAVKAADRQFLILYSVGDMMTCISNRVSNFNRASMSWHFLDPTCSTNPSGIITT
jgi:hypothetical protein